MNVGDWADAAIVVRSACHHRTWIVNVFGWDPAGTPTNIAGPLAVVKRAAEARCSDRLGDVDHRWRRAGERWILEVR